LDEEFEFESSILRPILRGRYIKQYIAPKSETLCIFPYDDTGHIIAEDIFLKEFPRTYEYLKSCQSCLDSGKLKLGQPWYAFREQDISYSIQSPKIVASVVNSGNGFTIDRHKLFCNNSVILIHPNEDVNPYFLLAVLNSKVFRIWAQHRMPTLGSSWYSYRVSILRKFPIFVPQNGRLLDKIANLATKLLNQELNEIDRKALLHLIDNMICKLYDIPYGEIAHIEVNENK